MNPFASILTCMLITATGGGSFEDLLLPESVDKHISVKINNTKIVLKKTGNKTSKEYNLGKYISANGEYSWQLLDSGVVGGTVYLLFRVSGLSRPSAPSGYCGAGEEVDLIWISSRNGRIVEIKSECIESCFQSMESKEQSIEFGKTWESEYSAWVEKNQKSKSELKRFRKIVTYKFNRPDQGILVLDRLPAIDF